MNGERFKLSPGSGFITCSTLSPDEASVDDLRRLLVAEFPEVDCVELQSRHSSVYKSFKVTLKQDSVRRAWKRELWPGGALVSRSIRGQKEASSRC